MATVAVTCIKNGRTDSFGRPLIAGTYYPAVEINTANALCNAGYVSVADASVFDQDPLAGTSPLDDFNVSRSIAISRQPIDTAANLAAELAMLDLGTAYEVAGAVDAHAALTTTHGISTFGATLVDDADAATARATLSVPSGSGNSTGTNTGNETTETIGTMLNGATSKTTPVDADHIGLMDSAASNILKKLSWANLKTGLSSIFVTLAGVSQTMSGKLGLGVTPIEKLSVDGNVNISGGYLYGNAATGNVEMYGFFTDFTGYDKGGMPALIPTAFDRLMFLDKKGGAITSSIVPDNGALAINYMVDGSGLFTRFDATGAPVVITMTLEAAYSAQRDFSIIFYSGYAPSSFTVQFYDASDTLLGQDVQTAWPSTKAAYVFKTSGVFYNTKKIVITLNAPKTGYGYYHIFAVFWSNYAGAQFPSSVSRKFGGDVYVGLNVAVDSGSFGVGTSSPQGKMCVQSSTEQLRCRFDASNYLGATTNSVGLTTFNMVGTAPAAKWVVSDATANAIYDVATFSKNSTGAGAAGLGVRVLLAAKSSTTVDTIQAGISSEWSNATHATRTSLLKLSANDYGGAREGIRIEADGTAPRLGFYGAAAVVKPTALTATVSAAPSGGTGTAAGGWDTSANRDLAIATINNLKTRLDQLETKLQALGLLT